MKIALLGDIALIGRYDRTEADDVSERVRIVRELVGKCDAVIANLEAPLTSLTRTKACKGVYLRSDPVNVDTLLEMGVTHVTLANNHIFDYGKKGADDTCAVLEAAGIAYVGIGNLPAEIEVGTDRVLMDGFCCLSANALRYGKRKGFVKLLTPETLETFLDQADREAALPIVSAHFGLEGLHYAAAEHMRLFRQMAEKHNYILHGNHPHAIQGYEKIRDSYLYYALGNLCFDEAKNTSIGRTRKGNDEERKCYVCILEILKHQVTDTQVIALTDCDSNILHMDEKTQAELESYSNKLKEPLSTIMQERDRDMQSQRQEAEKRNLQFFMNRMNVRYIGAFLNGQIHAREYNRVFKDYLV